MAQRRAARTQHVARGEPLLLRSAPALQPHTPTAIERQRERAAISGGVDVRIGGTQLRVARDPILDGQARPLCQIGDRDGTDADDE
jgi:hypothetical protein